ncbi:hypothetical protein [Phenylobacterium sp.]|uniref:hypothetical protein n=1 Tax=Phenylobacterium sp. TaxID=1871053 RepID=UPI0025D33675|nr:hypothetical protein [Phenylobacterium sp.]
MKILVLIALAAAMALAGCQKPVQNPLTRPSFSGQRGRFVGVGIYTPGRMWRQMAPSSAKDTAAVSVSPPGAVLEDDEQVIVVIDSASGELRQCGNLSGRCISMNPWSRPIAAALLVPVPLLRHAQDLDEEAAAKSRAEDAELKSKLKLR